MKPISAKDRVAEGYQRDPEMPERGCVMRADTVLQHAPLSVLGCAALWIA